jgi:LysM repeat protein
VELDRKEIPAMTLVASLTPATSPLPAHATPAVVVRRADAAPHGWQVLTVREGDTLNDIAITHRTTVGVLITRNRISWGGHFLALGTHLSVPRTGPAPRLGRSGAAIGRSARTATYVVRSGDTLAGIAARFQVSLSTLHSLNAIGRTAYIQPGQRVTVPAQAARAMAKAAAAAAFTTTTVSVRSGDTLGAIARRHGVSQASLTKANGLSVRSLLQIGQKLKVVTAKTADSGNTFAGRTYPAKIVNAASANRAHLARHGVPSRTGTKAMIVSTAARHGVDPRLALAISWQESGWNQRQVSVANAIGAMQVIPSSGVWASELLGRRLDLLSTPDNVTAGVVILRSLSRSARTEEEAIAGYYQGLQSVLKNGMYPDTKQYVKSVLLSRDRM